jgi:large subunit ribosomal protein L25
MIRKEIPSAVRDSFGKGPMRRLRELGKTPGVVYSGGKEALALEFETKVLYNELLDLQGRNAVLTLKIDDGSEKTVIVKEIQTEPVRDSLYHADFLEIDLDQPVKFSVPVNFTGTAKGEDLGGMKAISRNAVMLEGQPLSIPDDLAVDISDMVIGDKITAGEIALPEGVALLSDSGMVCFSIVTP